MLAGMLLLIPLSLFGKQCKQNPVYGFLQIRLLGSIPTPLNAAVMRLNNTFTCHYFGYDV